MKIFLFMLTLFLALNLVASDAQKEHKEGDHEDEHEEKMDLPAGIVSFNDEDAEFTLKPNVVKNFGIAYEAATKSGLLIKTPTTAIVRSLNETSVFLYNQNSFRNLKVTLVKSEQGFSYLKNDEGLSGKLIVTKGTNFLKTILLSLEEGPSEGHGH